MLSDILAVESGYEEGCEWGARFQSANSGGSWLTRDPVGMSPSGFLLFSFIAQRRAGRRARVAAAGAPCTCLPWRARHRQAADLASTGVCLCWQVHEDATSWSGFTWRKNLRRQGDTTLWKFRKEEVDEWVMSACLRMPVAVQRQTDAAHRQAEIRQIGRTADLDAPRARPEGEGQGRAESKREEKSSGRALGGPACRQAGMKKRFDEYLDELSKGHEPGKVRMVLEKSWITGRKSKG